MIQYLNFIKLYENFNLDNNIKFITTYITKNEYDEIYQFSKNIIKYDTLKNIINKLLKGNFNNFIHNFENELENNKNIEYITKSLYSLFFDIWLKLNIISNTVENPNILPYNLYKDSNNNILKKILINEDVKIIYKNITNYINIFLKNYIKEDTVNIENIIKDIKNLIDNIYFPLLKKLTLISDEKIDLNTVDDNTKNIIKKIINNPDKQEKIKNILK